MGTIRRGWQGAHEMPRVLVRAIVEGFDEATALGLVTDYARWAGASDSVREVRVERDGDGWSTSYWEVVFRGGVMKWSERDHIKLDERIETFELIEGDPHRWSGHWTVAPAGGGSCALEMDADFDLGMPSLSHVLDPIAVEALEDAVASVVAGLFGEATRVEFGARSIDAQIAP
jgi:ribosome-associated toxin RatA of RatAB toxin-antitoxin module